MERQYHGTGICQAERDGVIKQLVKNSTGERIIIKKGKWREISVRTRTVEKRQGRKARWWEGTGNWSSHSSPHRVIARDINEATPKVVPVSEVPGIPDYTSHAKFAQLSPYDFHKAVSTRCPVATGARFPEIRVDFVGHQTHARL